MTTEQLLTEIHQILKNADRILISGQGDPDGDSLGSQIALYDILKQQRRAIEPDRELEIAICNDLPVPQQYEFYPNLHQIVPVESLAGQQFDAGFVLDSGTDRVGKVLPILQTCRHVVNIDHHQSRKDGIETLAWIEPGTCSVCEMLYAFFEHPEWEIELNPTIAFCLYAGIIYDTGSFRYPKTTSRTHHIAGKCLETGIDFDVICEKMYLEKPLSSIRLLSEVLASLQCSESGNVIWGKITQEGLRRAGATMDQDEGIITNYAFTQGTKVAALFKEQSEREIKVSFRAHGDIDVGKFAQKMSPQKGGGHDRAAGCTLNVTIAEAERLIVEALEEELSAP
ncbi:MAG: bifunctional oligoribonuclease/PAP phosphatase NrnA [bacterium]|nr:bifunctional oligoribonuclease/PAP phosphatase NrnA [bacterium]